MVNVGNINRFGVDWSLSRDLFFVRKVHGEGYTSTSVCEQKRITWKDYIPRKSKHKTMPENISL